MNYTQEQAQAIYKDAQSKGLDPNKVMSELVSRGAVIDGIDMEQARNFANKTLQKTEPEPSFNNDLSSDIRMAGQEVKDSFQKRGENIQEAKEASDAGEQSQARGVLQGLGQSAGFLADTIGTAFKTAVKIPLSQEQETKLKEKVGEALVKVSQSDFGQRVDEEAIQPVIDWKNSLSQEQQRDIEALGGVAALFTELVGVGTAKRTASVGVDVAKQGIKKAKKAVKETATEISQDIAKSTGNTKDSVLNVLSPDIDPSFKAIISNTKTDKFDDFVRIADEASNDVTKPSVYEKVAENMTNATKQINSQVKSLSQQKKDIIGKAKVGLEDFTKPTNATILEINKTLKDNAVAKSFIARLKKVETKLDADEAIDDLQNVLYKGNKDMTIPVGSMEDKALKSIIGKYNQSLKKSLPDSYAKLNTEISNRLKALNIINRSLGETVDGVSTRGAGLVKQFFSPAGTKTKKLFEYVKKTTGVDLAEDAVLAKYIGEAFGDTKIKSLLEGVPTSRTGVIDKALDFTLEKTGVSKALRNAKQKGMLSKARKLTK